MVSFSNTRWRKMWNLKGKCSARNWKLLWQNRESRNSTGGFSKGSVWKWWTSRRDYETNQQPMRSGLYIPRQSPSSHRWNGQIAVHGVHDLMFGISFVLRISHCKERLYRSFHMMFMSRKLMETVAEWGNTIFLEEDAPHCFWKAYYWCFPTKCFWQDPMPKAKWS